MEGEEERQKTKEEEQKQKVMEIIVWNEQTIIEYQERIEILIDEAEESNSRRKMAENQENCTWSEEEDKNQNI